MDRLGSSLMGQVGSSDGKENMKEVLATVNKIAIKEAAFGSGTPFLENFQTDDEFSDDESTSSDSDVKGDFAMMDLRSSVWNMVYGDVEMTDAESDEGDETETEETETEDDHKSGNADNENGNADNNEDGNADNKSGNADNKNGNADNKSGSAHKKSENAHKKPNHRDTDSDDEYEKVYSDEEGRWDDEHIVYEELDLERGYEGDDDE